MERELNIQIPQWQLSAAGQGQCVKLTHRDDLGRLSCQRLRVLPVSGREAAVRACQALDMAAMLSGCANILCHRDHWACQREEGWAVCVQEADLPDLDAYCASRQAEQEELIVLSPDPETARKELMKYREKQRLSDEIIFKIGTDICRAMEQCRAKGIERCAVTEQTVYVSPGGDFLLGGIGIGAGDRPTGTAGLARLLCRLLGGQEGEPAFGDEKLKALVRKACAEEMDVVTLWKALERLAAGEPEPDPKKYEESLLAVLKDTLEQKKENAQAGETKPAAQIGTVTGVNTDRLAQQTAEPVPQEQDYSRIIRQKTAYYAVVSAGNEHTLCLCWDGSAVAIGRNGNQQCQVGQWRGLQAVAAGDGYSVGLRTNGTVMAVGRNGYGECNVGLWKDIVQVAVGSCHTAGLRANGTVVAVGNSIGGRCNVGGWKDIMQIAAGALHTVGLKKDGTVVVASDNVGSMGNVNHWRDIVAVAAGAGHTVGLKKDGTVMAAGVNTNGRCNLSEWKDIIQVAAGALHTVGLKKDGTVVAVGNNGAGRCDVSGWTDVVAIAAGNDHTVGLRMDGTLLATGGNSFGQCQLANIKNVCVPGVDVRITPLQGRDLQMLIRQKADRSATLCAGHTYSACVMDNGTVTCTGSTHNTKPWRMIKAVAVGFGHTVGLRVNGRILAEGSNTYGQCNVGAWEDIVQVVVGDHHTVGLKADGTVLATGNNSKGQCQVAGWKNIAAVSAGAEHTVGLRADGTVVAVGNNEHGQLEVAGWRNIVAVSAGADHTVGLCNNGRVVAVGSNLDGQCVVTNWIHIQSISAGMNHTVGVRADGSVVAIGRDAFGQCGVGKWRGIVAVSAGRQYTLGLRGDGSVVAAGLNSHGQCKVLTWRRVSVPGRG